VDYWGKFHRGAADPVLGHFVWNGIAGHVVNVFNRDSDAASKAGWSEIGLGGGGSIDNPLLAGRRIQLVVFS